MNYNLTSAELSIGVFPFTSGRHLAVAWVRLGALVRINSLELWQRQDGTRFLRWPYSPRGCTVAPGTELHEAVFNLICNEYDRQAQADKGGAING